MTLALVTDAQPEAGNLEAHAPEQPRKPERVTASILHVPTVRVKCTGGVTHDTSEPLAVKAVQRGQSLPLPCGRVASRSVLLDAKGRPV
jgi:hypothetical protein